MKASMFESIIKSAMSRGRVVLDECLESIERELSKRNIVVISVPKGMSDDRIKRDYLSGRLFITNNSVDFVDDASSYEYGIVSTEKIKFKEPEKLSKMISDAIVKYKLWSQSEPFLLVLSESGNHEMRSLSDR
jgi:hypothetical protein